MTEETNGAQNLPPPQKSAAELMDNFIFPVMATAVNGLQVGMRQMPIGLVLERVARMIGMVIGQTLSVGDLGSILKMRADCKKAFEEGMKSVKIQPPPASNQPFKLDS